MAGRRKRASAGDEPPSLAARLDLLFRAKHGAGKPEPSYQEVADALAAAGGPAVGATYIYMLRTGRRTNPRVELLTALARYFEVPVSYFVDDEDAVGISDQLRLLMALRDAEVQRLALRSSELSPANRRALATIIEQLRRAEGLSTDDSSEQSGQQG